MTASIDAPPSTGVQLVWFKRDLRIDDHVPLRMAAARGPVLPIYVVEPLLLHASDYDPRHWAVTEDALRDLQESLARLGQPLVVRVGDPASIFAELSEIVPIAGLWSHQETGNLMTYARDRRVLAWSRSSGIPWTETPQDGVVRRLVSRNKWEKLWDGAMTPEPLDAPQSLSGVAEIEPSTVPSGVDLGLGPGPVVRQRGGETRAIAALESFLYQRGEQYTRAMSSPNTAPRACSRLSPHLALGSISTRRVYHRAQFRLRQAEAAGEREWGQAMRSFISRLHWRGHFMQKLETEPDIEMHAQHPAYEHFWAERADPAYLEAWAAGETGYPLVDATMRSLVATGYLNFRMRAMLVSFACHDLRLHWRAAGLHLSKMFLDYEPGIHWPQMQMQAAATGINVPRIYDPTKAARDLDPTGSYIRRWIPELEGVPDTYIHVPWLLPETLQERVSCRIGQTYPPPIVDHVDAAREERRRIALLIREPGFQESAEKVVEKHGSRRRPKRRPQAPVLPALDSRQLSFGLEDG